MTKRKVLKTRSVSGQAASSTEKGAKSRADSQPTAKMEGESWAAEDKKKRKRGESDADDASPTAAVDETISQYKDSSSDSSEDEETTATDFDASVRSVTNGQPTPLPSTATAVELGQVILFVATDSAVRTFKAPFVHVPLLSLPKNLWEGKTLQTFEEGRTQLWMVPLHNGEAMTQSPCAIFTLADGNVDANRVSAATAISNLTFRSWVTKRKGISLPTLMQELSNILPARLTEHWGYQQIGKSSPQELLVPGHGGTGITDLVSSFVLTSLKFGISRMFKNILYFAQESNALAALPPRLVWVVPDLPAVPEDVAVEEEVHTAPATNGHSQMPATSWENAEVFR